MDRLVKPDVKEVELSFKKGQRCTTTFRLNNLMHTMSVAVSLTTSNPSLFSFAKSFSIIPPLSSSSYTLHLSQLCDQPPLSTPDTITVKSSILPTGKANHDELRRLFSRPGPHVFKDAILPISFVGPHVAEYLISHHPQIPDIDSLIKKSICGCNKSQLTPLLRTAVTTGNAKLVSCLIDSDADVNAKDGEKPSMLSVAVRTGSIEVVKALIASGCTIDNHTDLILHDAAAVTNKVDLMEVLLAGFKDIEVNSVDSEGRTPIHVAAVRGHTDLIRYCVSIGGNCEILDNNGWSPLHFAAEEGHMETVECLLEHSVYIKNVVNKDGNTAFALAMENGHTQLYDLLHLGDLLHRAARCNDIHGIKRCIAEGAKVNGKDQNGWTPLHRAASKGKIESVKVLLSHGAEVDVVDDAGYTPLHCAVEAGHVEIAVVLISHGARANSKSLKGVIPSNFDCVKNCSALVKPNPLCVEKEVP